MDEKPKPGSELQTQRSEELVAHTPPDASPVWPTLAEAEMAVSIVLGEANVALSRTLEWAEGSLIEVDKESGQPVDVLVNGKLCFRGEVVTVAENFGVRITEIISNAAKID
jgi:flagellar motor switch protein FliN/FliY